MPRATMSLSTRFQSVGFSGCTLSSPSNARSDAPPLSDRSSHFRSAREPFGITTYTETGLVDVSRWTRAMNWSRAMYEYG
ncbi:MAG: hypothetical protein ACRDSJ_13990, partial [Rubrobacteraceae bacterium]